MIFGVVKDSNKFNGITHDYKIREIATIYKTLADNFSEQPYRKQSRYAIIA